MKQMTTPPVWKAAMMLLVACVVDLAPHVGAFVTPATNSNNNNNEMTGRSQRSTATAVQAQRFNFVADGFNMQDQMKVLATRVAGETTTTTTTTTATTTPSNGVIEEGASRPATFQADPVQSTTVTSQPAVSVPTATTSAVTATTAAGIEMERARLRAVVEHAQRALQEFEQRHGIASDTADSSTGDVRSRNEAPVRVAVNGIETSVPKPPVAEKVNGHGVATDGPSSVVPKPTTTPTDVTPPVLPRVSGSVTEQRNTQVLRASKDGKSRWGESEVKRIVEGPFSEPVAESNNVPVENLPVNVRAQFLPLVSGSVVQQRNTHVLRAAEAGKSRWGNAEVKRIMEGPVTEQPIATTIATTTTLSKAADAQTSSEDLSLFEQRNRRIVHAAAAGKSRWGVWEVMKAKEGVTLKEALAIGKSTNWGKAAISMIQASPESLEALRNMSLFEQRNRQILNAAEAGKSRWGDWEIRKAKEQNDLREALMVGKSTNWGAAKIKESDTILGALETENLEKMSLFERRSKQILDAAAAGKSRWGHWEIEKVKEKVGLKEALKML